MIRKILVPVDGSDFAESALTLALAIGAKTGAEVRLAMANEPTNLSPGLWAEAFLANHAKSLEALGREQRHVAVHLGNTVVFAVDPELKLSHLDSPPTWFDHSEAASELAPHLEPESENVVEWSLAFGIFAFFLRSVTYGP